MTLAEKAKARTLAPKRNPIDVWLDTLDAGEREAGLSMLNDPQAWPQWLLTEAFGEEGLRVSRERVGEWRRANNVAR